MAEKSNSSRRNFIKQLSATAALAAAGPLLANAADLKKKQILQPKKRISPNDKIRFATIGMGIMGYNDTATALKVPNSELVAAADLYDGRLTHVKELYGKKLSLIIICGILFVNLSMFFAGDLITQELKNIMTLITQKLPQG